MQVVSSVFPKLICHPLTAALYHTQKARRVAGWGRGQVDAESSKKSANLYFF
jgi:hypothetical protein